MVKFNSNLNNLFKNYKQQQKYAQKAYSYYRKMGLNAVVKSVPEYKQSQVIYNLLKIYNPDILVITRTW